MMHKRIKLRTVVVSAIFLLSGWAALSLTYCCKSGELSTVQAAQNYFRKWRTYYSTDLKFSVQFPDGSAPKPMQKGIDHRGEKVVAKGFVAQDSDRVWGVLVLEKFIPKLKAKLTTQTQLNSLLDSYVDGAIKNAESQAGAKLRIREVVALGKYPGRRVEVGFSNGFVSEMNVYLVEGAIYQLEYGYSPAGPGPSTALDGDLFFKSFRVGQGTPIGATQLK
jgi:hypothetical protein